MRRPAVAIAAIGAIKRGQVELARRPPARTTPDGLRAATRAGSAATTTPARDHTPRKFCAIPDRLNPPDGPPLCDSHHARGAAERRLRLSAARPPEPKTTAGPWRLCWCCRDWSGIEHDSDVPGDERHARVTYGRDDWHRPPPVSAGRRRHGRRGPGGRHGGLGRADSDPGPGARGDLSGARALAVCGAGWSLPSRRSAAAYRRYRRWYGAQPAAVRAHADAVLDEVESPGRPGYAELAGRPRGARGGGRSAVVAAALALVCVGCEPPPAEDERPELPTLAQA